MQELKVFQGKDASLRLESIEKLNFIKRTGRGLLLYSLIHRRISV